MVSILFARFLHRKRLTRIMCYHTGLLHTARGMMRSDSFMSFLLEYIASFGSWNEALFRAFKI